MWVTSSFYLLSLSPSLTGEGAAKGKKKLYQKEHNDKQTVINLGIYVVQISMNSLEFCDSGCLNNFISFVEFPNETTPEIWVDTSFLLYSISVFVDCIQLYSL